MSPQSTEQKRTRKFRRTAGIIGVVVVIALIVGAYLVFFQEEAIQEANVEVFRREASQTPNQVWINLTEHRADPSTINTTEIWLLQIPFDTGTHVMGTITRDYISGGEYDSERIDSDDFREDGDTYGGKVENTGEPRNKAISNMTLYDSGLNPLLHRSRTTQTAGIFFMLIGDEDLTPRILYLELTVKETRSSTTWVKIHIT